MPPDFRLLSRTVFSEERTSVSPHLRISLNNLFSFSEMFGLFSSSAT